MKETLKYNHTIYFYKLLFASLQFSGLYAENNVDLDRHFFILQMDAAGIQYVYIPVRQVKRCIRIEMPLLPSNWPSSRRLPQAHQSKQTMCGLKWQNLLAKIESEQSW